MRKRRTKAQIEADRKAKAQVEDARAAIVELSGRANALRSKERDFHGLDREFAYAQTKMTVDFKESSDVSHPRDVGAIRENLLRRFFKEQDFSRNATVSPGQVSEPRPRQGIRARRSISR